MNFLPESLVLPVGRFAQRSLEALTLRDVLRNAEHAMGVRPSAVANGSGYYP